MAVRVVIIGSLVVTLLGCGSSGNSTGETSTAGASGTSGGPGSASLTGSSSTTTDGGTAGGTVTGDGPSVDHGHIKVQLQRSDALEESPFAGTVEVQLMFGIGECLGAFYTDHPEYTQDGAVGGALIANFGNVEHPDYLCSQTDPARPSMECEVRSISHQLDVFRMSARYDIIDETIEDEILWFGPLPCPVLTGCDGVVSASNSVLGFDATDSIIWKTDMILQPDAFCDQDEPIVISVAP